MWLLNNKVLELLHCILNAHKYFTRRWNYFHKEKLLLCFVFCRSIRWIFYGKELFYGVPIDYLLLGDCTIFDECFLTFFTIYKTSIFKIMIYGPLRQLICLWCFKTRLTNKNVLNWGNFAAPFYTCRQLSRINIAVLGCIRTWNLSLWRNYDNTGIFPFRTFLTYYIDETPK